MSKQAVGSKNKFTVTRALAVLLMAALPFLLMSCSGINEKEVVERYKQELTLFEPFMTIEPKSITAETSKYGVTLTDVTFRFRDVPELTIVVDKIVQTGVDEPSYLGNYGDVTSIEKQSFTGIKMIMQGQNIATLDEYVEENIRLNYRDLRNAILAAKNDPSKKPEEAIIKAFAAMKEYSVAYAGAKNFNMNVMFVSATIASMEARDMNMLAYGPTSIDKMEVLAMGQKVFSVDRIATESTSFPAIFRDMMSDPEGFLYNNPEMAQKAETEPLSILAPLSVKGLVIENLMLNTSGSPLNLVKIAGDLNIEQDGLSFASNLDTLTLTREFLAQTPDLAILSDLVEDKLNLDAKFDFSMKHPADVADIVIDAAISDKTLGGFAMDVAMDTPKSDLYNSVNNRELQHIKSFGVTVENNGIVDFLVACYAATEMYDYEDAYEELLDKLYIMEEEATNKLQLEAASALIKIVEDGGSLNISFKPASPMSIADIDKLDENNLEAAGFTVSYTPPAAKQ